MNIGFWPFACLYGSEWFFCNESQSRPTTGQRRDRIAANLTFHRFPCRLEVARRKWCSTMLLEITAVFQ